MPLIQSCLAGIATSVLAAGVVTANSGVAPEPSIPAQPSVALTASTLPIIDIYWTLGPLTILRTLTLEENVPPNVLDLRGEAGTSWNAPIGPTFTVGNSFELPISRTTTPTMVDVGFKPEFKSASVFQPIGAIGPTIDLAPDISSEIHLIQYHGGTDGYGFGVKGTLLSLGLQGGVDKPETTIGGSAMLGTYEAQLAVLSTGGLKAGLSFSPYAGGGGASIWLGGTKIGTTLPSGQFKMATKLCLGSAAASCGGVIASFEVAAMLGGSLLTINTKDVLAFDFPDSLKVELKAGSLEVTGNIGGTVTIGTAKLGGVVPINIKIPPAAAAAAKPAQVSSKAVPAASKATARKSASAKESVKTAKPSKKQGTGAKSARPAKD